MPILANHHVLAVPDVQRSAAWFARVFDGVAEPVAGGGWIFVRCGGVVFMLGECPDAPPIATLGDHRYVAYLVVDDVDAVHRVATEAVATLGGAIRKPPTDEPWGMRELALQTVDGHRIMVATNLGSSSPAWPAPPDGRPTT